MGLPVESQVYALWGAPQSAQGTPAEPDAAGASGVQRFAQVGGDIDLNRDDGSENRSDLTRYGGYVDFINSVIGQGSPVIQAQANQLAWLNWAFFGTSGTAFTAKAVGSAPPKYVFTPGDTLGHWSTWWKRVGLSTKVRQKFNDTRITAMRYEGSTANKVVKVTPTLLSIDPGEVYDDTVGFEEPTVAMGTQDPFLFTEAHGAIVIDGVTYEGSSQFAIVCDDGITPYYGDTSTPYALVTGNAAINLEGVTLLLDDTSYERYCSQIYGDPTPAAGSKPLRTVPALGSYVITFTRGSGDTRLSFKIEIPGVKFSPDMAIAPNPDGGAIEFAMAGQERPVAGQPHIRVTVETGAGVNTAFALPA